MKTLAPFKNSCKTSTGLTDEPEVDDTESRSFSELHLVARLQLALGLIERRWRQRIGSPIFDGSMEQELLRGAHLALGELWEFLEREDAA